MHEAVHVQEAARSAFSTRFGLTTFRFSCFTFVGDITASASCKRIKSRNRESMWSMKSFVRSVVAGFAAGLRSAVQCVENNGFHITWVRGVGCRLWHNTDSESAVGVATRLAAGQDVGQLQAADLWQRFRDAVRSRSADLPLRFIWIKAHTDDATRQEYIRSGRFTLREFQWNDAVDGFP